MKKQLDFLKLFSLVFIFLFASCQKNELEVEGHSSPKEEYTSSFVPKNRIVNEEQAASFVNKAMNALMKFDTPLTKGSRTRSATLEVSNTIVIKDKNGNPTMYVTNFGNGNGYMLVSADKEQTNPMLAFADIGTFDVSLLNENTPFASFVNEKIETISENLYSDHELDLNKASSYEMWEYLGEEVEEDGELTTVDLDLVSFESVNDLNKFAPIQARNLDGADSEEIQTRGRHRESKCLRYISPYMAYYLKWGQDNGYNADAPSPNWYLAGCPAVAVGQICYINRFPYKYNYSEMPYELPKTTQSNPISKMFRDIANTIPNYSWGRQSSGATGDNILTGLKRLGYKNARYQSYNFRTVYWDMYDGYPVLLAGFGSSGGGYFGHIWLANGYQEFIWKVTKWRKKFLGRWRIVGQWYEYADYIYMNWGWFGTGNTWVDQENWRSSTGAHIYSGRSMYTNLKPMR